jgi:hypothetical protein
MQLQLPVAPAQLHLCKRHGQAWFSRQLREWEKNDDGTYEKQLDWIARVLPAVAGARGKTAIKEKAFANALAQQAWDSLNQYLDQATTSKGIRTRGTQLAAAGSAFLGVIQVSHAADNSALIHKIIRILCSNGLPVRLPLAVLLEAQRDASPAIRSSLAPVHAHCAGVIDRCLDVPVRAQGDWSISLPLHYGLLGNLADPLRRFLVSSDQKRLEWPLAEQARQLVQRFIDQHELPLTHTTRRSGRPYTLVLEKTEALFTHASAERAQWEKDRAWLIRTAGQFA